jgi:hypothetical protein
MRVERLYYHVYRKYKGQRRRERTWQISRGGNEVSKSILRTAGDLSKFRSGHFQIQVSHFTACTNSLDADKNWLVTAAETLEGICQVPLRSDCDDWILYSSASVGPTQKLNRPRIYIYIMYQLFEQSNILHEVQYSTISAHKKKAQNIWQI